MTRPLLELAGVVVRYGERTALDDVTMTAAPGTVTAVVGGDGAGKTTLMRTVVGQVPVAAGALRTPEQPAIGYLPATSGSWAGLTVQENVEFVGGSYGLSGATLAEHSDELLAVAGLDPFRDRLARQLSGGMRRKLGVCLAMLHDPALLVLDEPSTGVDPVSRVDLWSLAARAASAGGTVLMTTTYLDEAERAAHVVVLNQGHVLVAGPPKQIRQAMPGLLTRSAEPVRPQWAWRRGRSVHELWVDELPPEGLAQIEADLEDVVTARSLVSHAAERGAP